MAGANNKALKKAGMTAREVETFRASGGKSLRATATAAKHSPTVQAANADFRAKAAAGLKSIAERKAALQAARQQRVGRSLGDAMKVARGMRQKQAADAAKKAAAAAPKTLTHAHDALDAVPGFHVRHWKGDKKERVYVSSSAFKGDAYVEKSGKYFVVTAKHNADGARIERALRKAGLEI